MIFVVFGLLLVLLIVAPQWWVKRTLRRHGDERADFPGTGGELARHLLDRAGLNDVKVEVTPDGDHYDGAARAVRLTPGVHDGRSVTAVAVAAHEVGHALQHAEDMPVFHWRTRLARVGLVVEKVGSVILLLTLIGLVMYVWSFFVGGAPAEEYLMERRGGLMPSPAQRRLKHD